ncbi:uncharacterized protein LOC133296884, partial [Gastrolobium bilobum]|uniref:uncharacterized protein LOC133296884 n=1 Tax=Gastrolobium bilobum TaxID=150636 RepID=UPI002AB10293
EHSTGDRGPSGHKNKKGEELKYTNENSHGNSRTVSRILNPFTPCMMNTPIPRDVTITTEKYNGKGDPQEHLEQFHTNMMAQDVADPIVGRLFPTTLKETALRWYFALSPNSVQSWEDGTSQFLIRFATSKAQYKSTHALKMVRQGPNITLRDYLNKFFDEALLVKDLDPQVSLHLITEGLLEGPFSMSLAKQRPRTIEELRVRSVKIFNLEDYNRSREISNIKADKNNFERDTQKNVQRKFCEKRKWERYDNYTPLNTSRDELHRTGRSY